MSFAMQEPEPLRLRHDYGPEPSGRTSLPSLEAKPGGRKPSLDHEGRKRIGLEPGSVAEAVEKYGYSKSFVMTCRREFMEERRELGLDRGPKKAYPEAVRRRIALTPGTLRDVCKQYNIATSTLSSYRVEFHAEREAAGLNRKHEETHAQATQASQKAGGNRGISRGATAGHAVDEKTAERRPEEKPADCERLGSRVMRAIQDWLL